MGPQANDAATPSRWRVNLSSASEGAKAMPSPLGYVPADAVSNVEARRRAKEEKEDAFARAPRAPTPPPRAERDDAEREAAVEDGDDAEGATTARATDRPRARSTPRAPPQRAMEMGIAPGKNIFMQGFMMWMSGSSINIFSIMITGMAFINPVKSILAIDDTFKRFAHDPAVDLTLPKLAFVGCNCGMIALALWKLNTMGLLPITAADWTSFLVDKTHVESSSVPIAL